ncbi:UGT-49 protein [Aphelenchoides avenae]|nr:UGT-49 protein [Aphelenchus avenae]
MMGIIDMLTTACDGLQRPDLIEELRAEQFEAIITTHLSLCGTGLSHVLGIKTHILLSVCPLMELTSTVIGVPYPTSYVPSVLDADYPDRMGYLERAGNLFNFWFSYYVFRTAARKMNVVFRKHYGPSFPDVDDLVKESALVLVNSDELVDFPRPTAHNVVNIGGLGLRDKRGQELKEPFRSEMEKGRRGVVFFSFGSNVRTGGLPNEVRINLFEAFAQLREYHFIVKVDAEDQFSRFVTANYTNVMLTEWAPQQQLLAHPRMRLFITHGGYNSLLESLAHGVPMLIMSFFADQHRNARVAERNGYGVRFDKRKLLEDSSDLVTALRAMRENER